MKKKKENLGITKLKKTCCCCCCCCCCQRSNPKQWWHKSGCLEGSIRASTFVPLIIEGYWFHIPCCFVLSHYIFYDIDHILMAKWNEVILLFLDIAHISLNLKVYFLTRSHFAACSTFWDIEVCNSFDKYWLKFFSSLSFCCPDFKL